MASKKTGVSSEEVARMTVSCRDVNAELWEAMRKEADYQGRNVRSVVDEMLSDWLLKTRKLATKRKQ